MAEHGYENQVSAVRREAASARKGTTEGMKNGFLRREQSSTEAADRIGE